MLDLSQLKVNPSRIDNPHNSHPNLHGRFIECPVRLIFYRLFCAVICSLAHAKHHEKQLQFKLMLHIDAGIRFDGA